MSEPTKPAPDLLNDAVREASGTAAAPSGPSATPATGASQTNPSRQLSIEEALQAQRSNPGSASGGKHGSPRHAAVRRPVDSSLRAAVAQASAQTGPQVGAGETAIAPNAAALSTAAPGDTSATGPRLPHWLTGLLLALAVFALVVGLTRQPPPAPAAAPRAPDALLNELTLAVTQYRSAHPGEWPATLTLLTGFPKGAVEWPLRYWNARDAAGRTEIIWAPQGEHFRILLRQGSETWTVSDREPTPTLLKKATP